MTRRVVLKIRCANTLKVSVLNVIVVAAPSCKEKPCYPGTMVTRGRQQQKHDPSHAQLLTVECPVGRASDDVLASH